MFMKQTGSILGERSVWRKRFTMPRRFLNIYSINREREPVGRSLRNAFHCCKMIWTDLKQDESRS